MYCKNCGQIVPKGIKECPTCGQPVKSKGVIVAVLIALAAVAFAAFVTVFFFLKRVSLMMNWPRQKRATVRPHPNQRKMTRIKTRIKKKKMTMMRTISWEHRQEVRPSWSI